MIQVFAKTDIGRKRKVNQDYVSVASGPIGAFPNLFILADGMGGHKAGDYASWFLAESLTRFVEKSLDFDPLRVFRNAVEQANSLLLEKASSEEKLQGMGSTLVMAVIDQDMLTCANIGDSRLYLIRDNEISQITRDHSYVEEMVSLGLLERDSEEYQMQKNIITRAVGIEKHVQPDFYDLALEDSDCILLCSDGLSNMLLDSQILGIVSAETDPEQTVNRLISEANEAGGLDNIAVILIRYRKEGDRNA